MSPVKDRRKGGVTAVDPRKGGIGPRTTPSYSITVRTFNAFSVSLPNCTVELYLTATDVLIETKNSGALGACTFTVADNTTQYYVKASKTGYSTSESAHTVVGGTSVDLTLIAVPATQPAAGGGMQPPITEGRLRQRIIEDDEDMLVIIMAYTELRKRRVA